ncbi:hypothetical protein BT96DRAFT_926593 [Gymnopus androsaceus JB14]|uniref:Uncharacterized protein n=1 Tax=Gymnopus androsaceus JB14 TaxID=1447944 RepID=A0A6A4GWH5_9AGAR|nr:hypothetical protein BT96DRAFT_926593 [Gymnopus androsaceus JB14]
MPTSFFPVKHGANSLLRSPISVPITPNQFLKDACHEVGKKAGEILQCSFSSQDISEGVVRPTPKGLVDTVRRAYGGHHALSLRPDDVWISILTQFSFYVNANAESLRSIYVDFGWMARMMTGKMRENITDPSLVDWIIPKFSTTTLNDVVVSSVLMMATMKHYFNFTGKIVCGIPKVTLEGEKSDWEELARRTEKLKEYGEEPRQWHSILHPILSQFVKAFDDPDGKENIDFWNAVIKRPNRKICGGPDLSGWITAFCVWTHEGKWMGPPAAPNSTANGIIQYHEIHSSRVPQGFAEIDVKLNDNGVLFDTIMVSGLVGMHVCDSNDKALSLEGLQDTVKPAPGWCIFIQRDDYITPEEEMRQLLEEIQSKWPIIPESK